MKKTCILILLALLQDVFTHPEVGPSIEVIRTKRKFVDDKHKSETETTTEVRPGIHGGKVVIPSEFPHLAAIGFWRHFKLHWLCGGTLINKRFVLTAAHCLEDKNQRLFGKAVSVRLGDIDLRNSSDDANAQQIDVMKRIAHPDYKHPKKNNDIGLLQLKQDAIFNDFVKPACLHKTYNILQTQAKVVGWGIKEFVERGQKPYKVVLDLHHTDICRAIVNRIDKRLQVNLRDDTMICAGVLAGGKDSCNGDSGGPLQVDSYSPQCSAEVIGIVSFGLAKCGLPNSPAIYVRVSHYVPWINSVIISSY